MRLTRVGASGFADTPLAGDWWALRLRFACAAGTLRRQTSRVYRRRGGRLDDDLARGVAAAAPAFRDLLHEHRPRAELRRPGTGLRPELLLLPRGAAVHRREQVRPRRGVGQRELPLQLV